MQLKKGHVIENEVDLAEFEIVCKMLGIKFRTKHYKYTGKEAIPIHGLQVKYLRIAKKYIPYGKVGGRTVFAGEIIQRLAKELDVYVTDIVRF